MGLGKELKDADKGFGIVARYPQFRQAADHPQRGGSGGLRGLLDAR